MPRDGRPVGRGVGRSRRANGEGSVYRAKDGQWVGATCADTNTGGRKRVVVYGRTRADAREKLTKLKKELDPGVRVAVENWNVQGYLENWLETVAKRRHIVPRIGKKKLRTLTVRDLRLMCEGVAVDGLQRRGVQFVHAVRRAGLQNAMRDELVRRNVAKLVQVAAPVYEVGHGLPPDEARKLLVAAKSDWLPPKTRTSRRTVPLPARS